MYIYTAQYYLSTVLDSLLHCISLLYGIYRFVLYWIYCMSSMVQTFIVYLYSTINCVVQTVRYLINYWLKWICLIWLSWDKASHSQKDESGKLYEGGVFMCTVSVIDSKLKLLIMVISAESAELTQFIQGLVWVGDRGQGVIFGICCNLQFARLYPALSAALQPAVRLQCSLQCYSACRIFCTTIFNSPVSFASHTISLIELLWLLSLKSARSQWLPS